MLGRGMVGQRSRTGLLAALIALAFAVFAFVPAVDAATCGVEPAAAHGQALIDADQGGDASGPETSHGVCNHGHCHHGGSVAPNSAATPPLTAPHARDLPWRTVETLLSRTPGGLERPPRA